MAELGTLKTAHADEIAESNKAMAELSERVRVLVEENVALKAALAAAGRMFEDKYLDWASAAGPSQCLHGVGAGIACYRCDRVTLQAALAKETA